MQKPAGVRKGTGGRRKASAGAESKIVNIIFDAEFLARIDRAAAEVQLDRSSFIRHTLSVYLSRNRLGLDGSEGDPALIL